MENNLENGESGFSDEELDENLESVRFSIQTYDVDGLIRRLNNKDIIIPSFTMGKDELDDLHGFQRNFVWKKPQMDVFIESVLMKYPTQGLFLVEQADDSYLLLDGQQRLQTVKYFQEGVYPHRKTDGSYENRDFILTNVSKEFRGISYEELRNPSPSDKSPEEIKEHHRLRRTFDNYAFSATIIRTHPFKGNRRAIYQIFERINSKGTLLNPHEIRIATFAGKLVQEIADINANTLSWRSLYGNLDNRLNDHETISRIFALFLGLEKYKTPIKDFINRFYISYSLDTIEIKEPNLITLTPLKLEQRDRLIQDTKKYFVQTCDLLWEIDKDSLKPAGPINKAWMDAIFVGIMKRVSDESRPVEILNIRNSYYALLHSVTNNQSDENIKFIAEEYGKHASNADNTAKRIKTAIDIFNNDYKY